MSAFAPVFEQLPRVHSSIDEPRSRFTSGYDIWNAFPVLRLVVRIFQHTPCGHGDTRWRRGFVTGNSVSIAKGNHMNQKRTCRSPSVLPSRI